MCHLPSTTGASTITNLSFNALNCNSLNIACSPENYDLKMDAVCSLKSDVIFLSDVRMGQISNQHSSFKIMTSLNKSKLSKHLFLYNSSSNKQGVAMLINKNLSPEIVETFKDQDENILLCAIKLNGAELILGSIYGPNNTDRNFYRNLENFIEKYPNWPVVLGVIGIPLGAMKGRRTILTSMQWPAPQIWLMENCSKPWRRNTVSRIRFEYYIRQKIHLATAPSATQDITNRASIFF
jgi:hypothetical protein